MSTRVAARRVGPGSLWLFTGDLDSDRTACVAVSHSGLSHAGTQPSRPLRQLPAGPVGSRCLRGGVRPPALDVARPARCPRCLLGGRLRGRAGIAAACALRHERAWRKAGGGPWRSSSPRPSRWSAARPVWWPAAAVNGVAPAGLCRFHDNRLRGNAARRRCPPRSWRRGWPTRSPGSRAHQFSLAGLAELVRYELLVRAAAPGRGSAAARPAAGSDPRQPPGGDRLGPPRRPRGGM